MDATKKNSFFAGAATAGIAMGLCLTAVHLLSLKLGWEAAGHKMRESAAGLAVILVCQACFARRYAVRAGGVTYARSMGFMVVATALAGLLAGCGYMALHAYVFDTPGAMGILFFRTFAGVLMTGTLAGIFVSVFIYDRK